MLAGPSRAAPLRRTLQFQQRTLFSLPDLVGSFAKRSASPIDASSASGREEGGATAGKGKGKYVKEGDMLTYHERKVMPYSPRQLYSVIANIEAYSSFVPYCTRSLVLSSHPPSPSSRRRPWLDDQGERGDTYDLMAELRVGFKGFEEGYVSSVQCKKWESVKSTADESSLFKHLSALWRLSSSSPHPLATSSSSATDVPASPSDTSTLVALDLAFAFRSPLHAAVGETVFRRISERMVDAFERRVEEVYGKSESSTT